MKIARIGAIATALMLAALATSPPLVQAGESDDAALQRQLEELRQQLRELQLKVQRLEAEHRAAPAGQPASAALSLSSPTQTGGTRPPPVVTETAQPAQSPPSRPVGTGGVPAGASPEPAAATPPESGTPSAPPAVREALEWHEALKVQWRSVRAGMSAEDITKLLGSPSRELTLDGNTVWYYSYPGLGSGSVLFSRERHIVTSWQHPPLGFGPGFW
ncbi:MAG: hypothetical protein ACWGNB_03655 [Thiogranum sp.]